MRNILDDVLCEKLSDAAHDKAKKLGVDISFAVYDDNAYPLLFRRFDDAPVISTVLVRVRHILPA